jgi:hypothetical protein
MGGTAEIADNFVPVDECVSFFDSRKWHVEISIDAFMLIEA